MRRYVIALVGHAGAGKDTAAEGLTRNGWTRVSFADPIRELALKLDPPMPSEYETDHLSDLIERHGWLEAKKSHLVRTFLQNLGTGVREVVDDYVWINLAEKEIGRALWEEGRSVVITDCRDYVEVDYLREGSAFGPDCGVRFVRIVKPGVGPVNGHKIEAFIDKIDVHRSLVNDGTPAELQAKLLAYVRELEQEGSASQNLVDSRST